MNNTQAKFILSSYRDSGEDARDPAFREALDQAERDPILAQWLRAEMELDGAVAGALRKITAPDSLVDDVLAAHHIQARGRGRRHSLRMLALAAGLLAVVGVSMFVFRPLPQRALVAYPAMAARFLDRPFSLELKTRNLDDVHRWLRAAEPPPGTTVPASLAAKAGEGIGCRSFTWHGEKVLLLCFALESGRPTHLFVMNARALPDAPPAEATRLIQKGQWATATWIRDGRAYLLATEGTLADVEIMLAGVQSG